MALRTGHFNTVLCAMTSGRMRWTYVAPEPSLVVSDGKQLWIYDPVNREAQHLTVTAAYLSGAALSFVITSYSIHYTKLYDGRRGPRHARVPHLREVEALHFGQLLGGTRALCMRGP